MRKVDFFKISISLLFLLISRAFASYKLIARNVNPESWTGKVVSDASEINSALRNGSNISASLETYKSLESWSAHVSKDSVAQFLALTDVIDAGTTHARTKIIQVIAMPIAKVPLSQSQMLYVGDACHRKNSNLGVAALVRGWGPKYKVFKAWQADDAGNKLVEVPVAEVTCIEEGP